MMGLAMILLVCLAAFAVCWLFDGIHSALPRCDCGLNAAHIYPCDPEETRAVAARLTELCPICRLQEHAP